MVHVGAVHGCDEILCHRLAVKEKLHNDDDDNDRDAASGDECRRRPLLLPIQSHLLSLSLNFIMDNLISLFIYC